MECLKHLPGKSYAYNECTFEKAMDHFIITALIGLVLLLGLLFLKRGKRTFKKVIVLAVFLSLMAVGAYYAYIPVAFKQVSNSAVNLESLWDK